MAWDYFQEQLEQIERDEGWDPPRGGRVEPPRPPAKPIVKDGLQYDVIEPIEFEYPAHIIVDAGTRIGVLNRELLQSYTNLANDLNHRDCCQAILDKNRNQVHGYQVEEMEADVRIANGFVRDRLQHIKDMIAEIDAVDSTNAYYIPVPLRGEIEMSQEDLLVDTGSLKYLAKKSCYFSEHCCVPPGIPVGDDTDAARKNMERKEWIEDIAFAVNRINYFEACDTKAPQLKVLEGKLFENYYKVPVDEDVEVLNMDADLRNEAKRILSCVWKKTAEPHRRWCELEEMKAAEETQKRERELQNATEDVVDPEEEARMKRLRKLLYDAIEKDKRAEEEKFKHRGRGNE